MPPHTNENEIKIWEITVIFDTKCYLNVSSYGPSCHK